MRDSKQRLAVVTGASRGVGLAIAQRLLADGWRVATIDREPVDVAGVRAFGADLGNPAEIETVCATLKADGVAIDGIVNNAAVQGGAPIGEQSLADWQRFLDINITAPWLLIKGLAPLLADQASIVNVGSVASVTGFTNRASYVASKHALLGLTRALAVEFAPRIRVNLLCLGTFETPTLLDLAAERLPSFVQRQLLNRLGQPNEAASAAAFLLSPEASFVTGSIMTVDGGMLAKGAAP